jgi:maltose O-acetyltransferase
MENEQSDKAKMLSGQLYRATGPELTAERTRAKKLCVEHNHAEREHRADILGAVLGRPTDAYFEPPFFCDYGYNLRLGTGVYANHNLVVLDCAPVTIGNDVYIGPNVVISAAGHPVEAAVRTSGLEFAHPVTIGNSVWIGANVTVLPGVTIGDNVTIGAGSVVTKPIPPDCVAVGNPCKVMREL